MRRMYSQAELSAIIKEVFLADVASGEIDLPDLIEQALPEVDFSEFDLECKSVQADSIIENMSGYSFAVASSLALFNSLDITYAGAVKNGNKLTLAVSGTYDPKSGLMDAGGAPMFSFGIPEAVGQKLFPTEIGGVADVLSYGELTSAVNTQTYKATHYRLTKASSTSLLFTIMTTGASLVADTTYFFRVEITFLLSDNLAE